MKTTKTFLLALCIVATLGSLLAGVAMNAQELDAPALPQLGDTPPVKTQPQPKLNLNGPRFHPFTTEKEGGAGTPNQPSDDSYGPVRKPTDAATDQSHEIPAFSSRTEQRSDSPVNPEALEANVRRMKELSDFLEQQSTRIAAEYRSRSESESAATLQQAIEAAFDARQNLYKAELQLFRARIDLAESQIAKRELDRSELVKRRLDQLKNETHDRILIPKDGLYYPSTAPQPNTRVVPQAGAPITDENSPRLIVAEEDRRKQPPTDNPNDKDKVLPGPVKVNNAEPQTGIPETSSTKTDTTLPSLHISRTEQSGVGTMLGELAEIHEKIADVARMKQQLGKGHPRRGEFDATVSSMQFKLALYYEYVESQLRETKTQAESSKQLLASSIQDLERIRAIVEKGEASVHEIRKIDREVATARADHDTALTKLDYYESLLRKIQLLEKSCAETLRDDVIEPNADKPPTIEIPSEETGEDGHIQGR
jgi:hypothetical protein